MKHKIITLIILSVIPLSAFAQPVGVAMIVKPESKLQLDGTSTLHDFTCTTSRIDGTIELDANQIANGFTDLKAIFTKADISIPVKSISSGKNSMDENMYEALKAEEFPAIRFTLVDVRIVYDSVGINGRAALIARGNLAIAGKEKTIEMPIQLAKNKNGSLTVEGVHELLMTEYDIDPPSFFLGTLKVGDKVVVRFDLQLASAEIQ